MGRDRPYLIAFEGGLGSQVMSYIDLFYCKLVGLDYRLNFDYFNFNKEVKQKSGLTHWKWELDNYGIELEQIITVEKNNLYKKRNKSASIKRIMSFGQLLNIELYQLCKLICQLIHTKFKSLLQFTSKRRLPRLSFKYY